jgi:hypothetical protein
MSHKEEGKNYFRDEHYQESLTSYRAALGNAPQAEKQILLSNIVACRLKIGGSAMAAAAVEEAKQVCVFDIEIDCMHSQVDVDLQCTCSGALQMIDS